MTGRIGIDDVTPTACGGRHPSKAVVGEVIPIGATPDRGQAMALLDNAKDRGGKALQGAQPFTVAVGGGGSQLYRARFAGFSGQDSAVNACKALITNSAFCVSSGTR